MNPWVCASLIALFGGLGGVVNALLSDNRFALPRKESGVLCPGAITNILIGSFAAFSSWSFYGSGASIDLADKSLRTVLSLRFSALAGAFLVGVAGARWISSEVDKRLLSRLKRNFRSTTQPTIRVALYDLPCVWQSPHACKLL